MSGPAIPYGQDTVWPYDLLKRAENLEVTVVSLGRRLSEAEAQNAALIRKLDETLERLNQGDTVAALSHDWGYGVEQRVNAILERLERIEARLLLLGVPSEP